MSVHTEGTSAAADSRELLKPLRTELLRLAAALVRTDSVNVPPHGREMQAQGVLREFFKAHGIESELYSLDTLAQTGHPWVRHDRDYKGRQNLSVQFRGSGRGRSLLLTGHIDTVPQGTAPWMHDPWSAHIENGRLYGLGSFDMKSGLAAQAVALTALHLAGVSLGGDVLFESVVDEEWGGGGGTLAALLRGVRADAAVISEGTQLEILRATRGGFVVDLVVQAGDPAQYFSSKPLVSPALPLARLLQWIEGWANLRSAIRTAGAYASIPDPAPVQVLAIEANRLDRHVPLSVPLQAAVRVYFQFLPEENVSDTLQKIRDSLDEFQARDTFFREHAIVWRPLYDPPLLGHELPESHPWTQTLASAVRSIRKQEPVIGAAPYPCDAFLLHEFGIPTLLFGPAGAGAHNPDEYVETDSIIATAESILAAAMIWCA